MSLVIQCEEHLAKVREFADKIGQRESLEKAIEWVGMDSFFGRPSRGKLSYDSAPHSFYFVVETQDRENPDLWHFGMNGGVIFHADYSKDGKTRLETGTWSVHT